jgi:predicted PurR-regulated permease PerM
MTTTEKGARRVFTGLIVLSIVLLALLIRPFAEAFFLAAVLAGAFHRLHKRMTRNLRGRDNLAAGLLCFMVIVALLLPLTGLTAFVVGEVTEGVQFVSRTLRSEGLEGLIQRLPGPAQNLAEKVMERIPVREQQLEKQLQEQMSSSGGTAAKAVTGAVATTGSLALQTAMMLIALFFFLVDGAKLVRWLESISPLKEGQTTEILSEFRNVSIAVLVSTLATAGVQATAALVGYLIAGVPVPLFFAGITFLLALIPAIGAAVVCLAAALILLIEGKPGWALFLAVWGVLVVGVVDNIVKPLLVKRGMQLHGGIVFFALLGGLAAFGTVGLLLGPLVVAFFLALVRIYERDYGRPKPQLPAPTTPPTNLPRTPSTQ